MLSKSNNSKVTVVTTTKPINRNLLRKETSFVCYTSSVLRKVDIWNKKKNYVLLLRSKLKVTKIRTSTKLFNKPDRNGHSAHWYDKIFLRVFAWFLSQTITWFSTDRNVQWKNSRKSTQVKFRR